MSSYNSTKFIILLICIVLQVEFVLLQQRVIAKRPVVRKHMQMCEQYKNAVFSKVFTFTGFVAGAPDIKNVVDNCKSITSPFIVGGTEAKSREFPHIVRIGYTPDGQTRNWFCGGTLISKNYVLTAAHCFFGNNDVNLVRLGELVFDSNKDDARPVDYYIQSYIIHPAYDNNYDYNDIALVKTHGDVAFSEYVLPACLPLSTGNEFNKFLAVGWGSTDFFKINEDALMKVTLDQYSTVQCNAFAQRTSTLPRGLDDKIQLCAGSPERKDTCTGDSGGPLLQFHDQFKCMYQVIGVTSTGIGGCGIANVPGIYTRVYNYINWIESIVWQN